MFSHSKRGVSLLSCMQSPNTTNSSLGRAAETSAKFVIAQEQGSFFLLQKTKTRNLSLWLALRKLCKKPKRSWRNLLRVWWALGQRRKRFASQHVPKSCCCSQDNVVEDTMTVDPKHHRYFVSRRGQVLRDLADEYGGVMVSFPRTGSQSEKVIIKGANECVEAAKKRIQEIIEDLVSSQRLVLIVFFVLFCY